MFGDKPDIGMKAGGITFIVVLITKRSRSKGEIMLASIGEVLSFNSVYDYESNKKA